MPQDTNRELRTRHLGLEINQRVLSRIFVPTSTDVLFQKPLMDDQLSIGSGSPSSSAADSAISMNASESYRCRSCAREFETSDKLNVHLTHTHRVKPQYDCKICDKVFAVRRELSTHKRVHSGEQPLQCKKCDKQFGTRQLLKKHEMWHTGKRSHVCSHCGKGFFQKGHLTQHLMIHRGSRPFACTLCEKTFIFKFDLNRHMKIHAERGFGCSLCSKSFSTRLDLDEHVCKKVNRSQKPVNETANLSSPTCNATVSISPELKREAPAIDQPTLNPEHVAQMAQALLAQQQQQRVFAALIACQQQNNNLSPIQLNFLMQQRQALQQLQSPFAQFCPNTLPHNFDTTPSPATAEEPPTMNSNQFRPLDLPTTNPTAIRPTDDHYESATSSSCASSPRKVSPMNPTASTTIDIANFGLSTIIDGFKSPIAGFRPNPCNECGEMRSKCSTVERELSEAHEEIGRLKELIGRLGSITGAMFTGGCVSTAGKFGQSI
ncbi:Zinc finger protein [Aphelenchoides besseyi]|nr:Zinc finger protein [Aphelenchoides besseyi]